MRNTIKPVYMIMNDMESGNDSTPPQHLPALQVITTTAGAAGAATGHATITTPIKPVITGEILPIKGGNVNPPPKLPPVTTDKGGGIGHIADVIKDTIKDISTINATNDIAQFTVTKKGTKLMKFGDSISGVQYIQAPQPTFVKYLPIGTVLTGKLDGNRFLIDDCYIDLSVDDIKEVTTSTPCNGCKKDAVAEPKKKKWLFVAVGVIVVIVLIRIFK